MVSAGLDTVPGNLIMAIAYLSSEDGQEIQKKAYNEIMKVYPDGDAWEKCVTEECVPYISAFVKEVLRFWSVIPICLPRTSTRDIPYEGAVIPSGTIFMMVSLDSFFNIRPANLLNCDRMPGLQITIPNISKTLRISAQNAIWLILKVLEPRI